eukprot:CAMPEP_0202693590 /NCGR_PEP_ID=MMETSP1385-20130828/7661_1 /ASSEMBLY_ACC=CAM_ASM_000861 /TAXON_ID=933848 /ORGANISM="Elphidium margaritaceum" /LENGTH=214 /DNA_ID=CAMNT_0049349287 /DNA_START=66 /DNA_END=710 /DNA_ORIENTATION=-
MRSKLYQNDQYFDGYGFYDDHYDDDRSMSYYYDALLDELSYLLQSLRSSDFAKQQFDEQNAYLSSRFTDDAFDLEEDPRTITEVTTGPKLGLIKSKQWAEMRLKDGKDATTSGSGGQSFLNNFEFRWGADWVSGHISLSPSSDDKHPGRCDSAHVTIVGHKHPGNYFFAPDFDNKTWKTSGALAGFKGSHTHNGNELPSDLQKDVIDFLEKLFW